MRPPHSPTTTGVPVRSGKSPHSWSHTPGMLRGKSAACHEAREAGVERVLILADAASRAAARGAGRETQ